MFKFCYPMFPWQKHKGRVLFWKLPHPQWSTQIDPCCVFIPKPTGVNMRGKMHYLKTQKNPGGCLKMLDTADTQVTMTTGWWLVSPWPPWLNLHRKTLGSSQASQQSGKVWTDRDRTSLTLGRVGSHGQLLVVIMDILRDTCQNPETYYCNRKSI